MTSAHDVADELWRRLPGLGVTKLHKLLYYAAGWHATWTGEPLFPERVEAWLMGPVVRDVWVAHKHRHARPTPQPLTDRQLATIDYVIDRYGGLSAQQLVRQTHDEDPWRAVSEADEPVEVGGNAEITPAAMRAWFEHDRDYVKYRSEVERLTERLGDDPFAVPPRTPDLIAAVERALAGDAPQHD